jgi:eukaryotic-like serine/threonine-protein kinase
MIYCINPRCAQRSNSDNSTDCLSCGTPLVIHGSYRLQRFLREPHPTDSTELFEVFDAWNSHKKKVLKSLINPDPLLLELFGREKKLLTNFDHPSIPKGEDFFQVTVPATGQELSCIVMEWIEGDNLQQWLQQQGAITQETALDWLRQITEILAYIHERDIFHRDIKPSNVMRRPDGRLVLIDFGAIKQSTQTLVKGRSLTVVSSHGYTAPEQLQGSPVLQSDFFALGRTFAHLLTGQHPSDLLSNLGYWRQSIQAPVSDGLVDLIDDLMSDRPEQRPQNAQALRQRIDALSHSSPTLISPKPKPRKRQRWLLWLGLFLLGLALPALIWWLWPRTVVSSPVCSEVVGDSLSCGEELLTLYHTKNRSEGVKAWKAALTSESQTQAVALYRKAIEYFEQSLKENRNDPEVRIYYNNARIQAEVPKSRTIAVVVPLDEVPGSSNPSRGLEILRGVAQAQEEVYQKGFKLKILIGDDRNQIEPGKEIARTLLGKDIPAVIGHYTSDVTEPTIPIYQSRNLVLVSPTSTAESLTQEGARLDHVFFRTVPSNRTEEQALTQFLKQKRQKTAAVFYNPNSVYSRTLAEGFIHDFNDRDKQTQAIKVPTFDLSTQAFNVGEAIAQVQAKGATAIAVFPDGYTNAYSFKNTMAIIQANQGKRWIVSGNSLLDLETLRGMTQNIAKRLVMVVPWHAESAKNQAFVSAATKYWGGHINWRTATAYDAVMVLATALKMNPDLNRIMLQRTLAANNFKIEGATGRIRFDGSDRQESCPVLLAVIPRSGDRFEFAPLSGASPSATDCKPE